MALLNCGEIMARLCKLLHGFWALRVALGVMAAPFMALVGFLHHLAKLSMAMVMVAASMMITDVGSPVPNL